MATILIVDDDVAIRETLRFALEDAGYEVVEAAGGAAALDVMRASARPLVVLLDRIMPPPDGEAVLEAARADGALASRHAFVLVTAGTTRFSPDFAGHLAAMGVPVLQKPFDLDVLLDAVALAARRLVSIA